MVIIKFGEANGVIYYVVVYVAFINVIRLFMATHKNIVKQQFEILLKRL